MTIYQGIVEACKRAGATPELIAEVVKDPPATANEHILCGREETFITGYVAILRGKPATMKQIVQLMSDAIGGPQN